MRIKLGAGGLLPVASERGMNSTTGHAAVMGLSGLARWLKKRGDHDGRTSALVIRDLTSNAAAEDRIDLSLPVVLLSDAESTWVENESAEVAS